MAKQFRYVLVGAATGTALALLATQIPINAVAKSSGHLDEYRVLELFDDAFEQVRQNYVERPDDNKLIENAINGMMAALGDSYYLDTKAVSHSVACPAGANPCPNADIGLRFTIADGLPKVVTAIDGSPAAKAGLMTGDVITSIDDQPLDGLSAYQVSQMLSGDDGSTVHLTALRPGQDKSLDLSMVRDHVAPRSVRWQVQGGDIGYIRIAQFNDNTGDELKKAMDAIADAVPADKLKGYVLDLRNNPGGALDGAIAASDAFLDSGDVVAVGGRSAANAKHIRVKAGNLSNGKRVIVLINAGSAATAEVVAGALQDNHRATLIGTRSYGAGEVLTELPLGRGQGVLRLATEQYFTPSGHVITAKGISPDIEVQQDMPDGAKPSVTASGPKKPFLQSYIPADASADKALNRAYAELRGGHS
ncbi:MAG TPA: S41 family peptidase [Xanthobacteraceae bacterium]|jgi:carboxyl-terminal processing protease|nr:S41 family peptidase [Xanthobacteraceae bacterium]